MGLVLARGIHRSLPARLHSLHQSARRVRLQGGTGGVAQGQAAGDLAQRGQVQLVGPQFALRQRTALGRRPRDGDIAAGPAFALRGDELQVLGLEFEAAGDALAAQAPGDRLQLQRLQVAAESGIDVGQHHVRRAADDAAGVDIGPGAQAAASLRDVETEAGVFAQLRQVDRREVRVHLAAPLLPAPGVHRQQRLAEDAGQGEALAPRGRRRGVQPQLVAVRLVARDEVDLAQRHRRGAAQFVGPFDVATLDHEFALAEEPVGQPAAVVAAARDVEAGHEDVAIGRPADLQLRPLDIQLLEAQAPQRARRQSPHHHRQLQRRVALRIEQFHVLQRERGHQALGAGADRAYPHRHAEDAAGANFHLGAQVADSRHNESVQAAPSERQQRGGGEQQPQGPLDGCCKQPQRA